MSLWITITPQLQQGLDLISQLDNGKFRQLVNRICQNLHSSFDDRIFTADEEDKLMISFNLNKDTLNLLLDTITLIYSQAAFGVVKPSSMESVMKETFSISHDKITIMTNAWIVNGKKIIDILRERSIFPRQIVDINWSLNVQTATQSIAIEPMPNVLLQLGMIGVKNETLTIEMDKSSVGELYDKLEKIQSQLDGLK